MNDNYWETRNRWTDPKSTAAAGTCDDCNRDAVVCYFEGQPIRAYHPHTVNLRDEPCPGLLHIYNDPRLPLSSDIHPGRVTVEPL